MRARHAARYSATASEREAAAAAAAAASAAALAEAPPLHILSYNLWFEHPDTFEARLGRGEGVPRDRVGWVRVPRGRGGWVRVPWGREGGFGYRGGRGCARLRFDDLEQLRA